MKIEKNIVIGGQVVSEDRSGNVYKSIYIQDATGGIELKIGKNALYNATSSASGSMSSAAASRSAPTTE